MKYPEFGQPIRRQNAQQDYITEIALGTVPGRSIVTAMGERENMQTTVTGEDIWRGNDLNPAPTSHTTIPTPPTAGEQMGVVSESVNDALGGTGIRTVRIHYLDSLGNAMIEDLDMNGTTIVLTQAVNMMFIQDMYAIAVGSNGVAADHVKIHAQSDAGRVYNMIEQGGNKSLVPHRMVPRAQTLILKGWHCAEAQSRRVAFRIRSTDMNGVLLPGVFCFKDTAYINGATSGHLDLDVALPSLSIVKVSGWPDVAPWEPRGLSGGGASWSTRHDAPYRAERCGFVIYCEASCSGGW